MNTLILTFLISWTAGSASAATVAGTVTDASGLPIKDARVDHTGKQVVVSLLGEPSADEVRTDNNGDFTVTTDKSAVVVRKPGYISRRILVTGDARVQVLLQRSTGETLCELSPPPKVKSKRANDVDYSATWFYIKTKHGLKGVLSGSGASYSWGAPGNSSVWTSVEYAEVMYESGMIDAWGHTSDGKYWRSRSEFGAAAQYFNVDRETAEQLNCVMDSVTLP